jgi:hypothetical protein
MIEGEFEHLLTTPEAEGLTQGEVDAIVERIESDDFDLTGSEVFIRPRGRQSLTGPGVHSPLISTRVPMALLEMLKHRADAEGMSVSALQRRILTEYLGAS